MKKNVWLLSYRVHRSCPSASQGGTVAIHFINEGLHRPYFSFSLLSRWYHTWNEIMLFLISRTGVLTADSPFLSLVKISWVIQGAVPPLCLQHTGSLLISYLSGEAVIIWGWASTMDNYPGKRISNCGENTAFSKGAWIHKMTGSQLVTAITSFYLPFFQMPSCDLDQPPTKQF